MSFDTMTDIFVVCVWCGVIGFGCGVASSFGFWWMFFKDRIVLEVEKEKV